MGKVKKYCHDCGSRLEYAEIIKGHRVPPKYKKNIYSCENCSEIKGHAVVMGVSRLSIPTSKFWEGIDKIMFNEVPDKKKKSKRS